MLCLSQSTAKWWKGSSYEFWVLSGNLGLGLVDSSTIRQGLKPLANSTSRLKTTEILSSCAGSCDKCGLIYSRLQTTLAVRQGFQPLSDFDISSCAGSCDKCGLIYSRLQTTLAVRQGFQPLSDFDISSCAGSCDKCGLIYSRLQTTLAVRQGFQPLSDFDISRKSSFFCD